MSRRIGNRAYSIVAIVTIMLGVFLYSILNPDEHRFITCESSIEEQIDDAVSPGNAIIEAFIVSSRYTPDKDTCIYDLSIGAILQGNPGIRNQLSVSGSAREANYFSGSMAAGTCQAPENDHLLLLKRYNESSFLKDHTLNCRWAYFISARNRQAVTDAKR